MRDLEAQREAARLLEMTRPCRFAWPIRYLLGMGYNEAETDFGGAKPLPGLSSGPSRLRGFCVPKLILLAVPSFVDYAVWVAARPLAIIGGENARLRSRLPLTEWSSAMERPRFNQIDPLDENLSEQAERLRKEARGTPPGVARDKLLRKARQIETASHVREWLVSPGLRSPD
jgi:hypothetical protein